MASGDRDIDQVLGLLDRVRREWTAARLLAGASAFLSIVLGTSLAFVCIAMGFSLPAGIREGLRAGWLVCSIAGLAVFIVRRLFENPTDEHLALLIEKAAHSLHNELINAVRLSEETEEEGRPFIQAAFGESNRRASSLRSLRAVDWRPCRRAALLTLGFAVGWTLLLVLFPTRSLNAMARIASPKQNLAKAGRVTIESVAPGDVTIILGENLAIDAVLKNAPPDGPQARVQHFIENGPVHEEVMQPVGEDRHRCVLLDIRAPRTYRVAVGDSVSPEYLIRVTERPRLTRIAVDYQYPPYTNLDPSHVEDSGGMIRAVIGSNAALKIDANKRLSSASLDLGGEKPLTLALAPGKTSAHTFRSVTITESLSGKIAVVDEFGCHTSQQIQIVAVPDTPPTVTLSSPGQDRILAVGESLQLAIRGADDYGIVQAELLEKRIDPSSGRVTEPKVIQTWRQFGDPRNAAIHWQWIFDEKDYHNGEIIRYCVRMTDGNTISGPGVGTSAEFVVRLEDAAARQKEREKKYGNWQAELEKILKEQRDLRNSTKTLPRERAK